MNDSIAASCAPGSLFALSVDLRDPGVPEIDLDPLAFAGPKGPVHLSPMVTLAGHGVAAWLEVPDGLESSSGHREVLDWLRSINRAGLQGTPGAGPVALGAFGFDRGAPARLVVPRLILGSNAEGERWATVVTSDGPPQLHDLVAAFDASAQTPGSTRRVWSEAAPPDALAIPSRDAFVDEVTHAIDALAVGVFDKVVLTRSLDLGFSESIDTETVLRRLRSAEPACTVFATSTPDGRFIGASPELLVSRRGSHVVSHPLAGTISVDGTGPVDRRTGVSAELMDSDKDRSEHAYVVRDIGERLGVMCRRLNIPDTPAPVTLSSLVHLGTHIDGELIDPGDGPPTAIELVAALHPTPAVGGYPRERALELIARLEETTRGPWAGPVGWMDAEGDGDWVLGIRSALLSDNRARLWAGMGVVTLSNPLAELAETDIKFAVMLEALAPGFTQAQRVS
jgi:menaquinone-specific isochorismate synthase